MCLRRGCWRSSTFWKCSSVTMYNIAGMEGRGMAHWSTAPAYFWPAHKLVHFASVKAGSIPEKWNVLKPVVEEKQPKDEYAPIVSGL